MKGEQWTTMSDFYHCDSNTHEHSLVTKQTVINAKAFLYHFVLITPWKEKYFINVGFRKMYVKISEMFLYKEILKNGVYFVCGEL